MQLLLHPATPRSPVRQFDVDATRPGDRTLRLSYRLDADLQALRLPAGATPARTDELWRHTCFEAFIAAPDRPGYREFNFSPSGQWAAYTFDGYRAGMRDLDLPAAPEAAWRRTGQRLDLDVAIRLEQLSADTDDGPLRLALAAVLEDQSGTITWWALRHPGKEPDFHHPGGFVLELPGRGAANASGN